VLQPAVPLVPADPVSLIGLASIALTVAMLVASDWPKAYLIGAATIVVFGLQFVDQVFVTGGLGLRELALTPAGVLAGEWWTPVTYAFLHGGFMHIAA
jgi:membrane associated rhomboid family serine protease